jgi:hypothetical protein
MGVVEQDNEKEKEQLDILEVSAFVRVIPKFPRTAQN